MQYLAIIFKYLPELINLVKWIAEQTSKDIENAVIKSKMRAITKAFDETNRSQAAHDLNNVFRGPQ
jgi:hypothetical protein